MPEQEKQPLTPEELVARKGDIAPDRNESPCGDPSVSKTTPAAQFATLPTNGMRPQADSERTTPHRTPSA